MIYSSVVRACAAVAELPIADGDPTGLSSTWSRLIVLGALVTSIALLAKAWWQHRDR